MDSIVNPSELSGNLADRFSHLRELNRPSGYIYIVRDVEISGTYKIGYTSHPAKRFAVFDDELPFRVEPGLILEIHGDAKSFEHSLHIRYQSLKKFGEWFRLSDRDLRQLCAQYKDRIVIAAKADFLPVRARKFPREITYVPAHNYENRPKVNSPGYVYVIQDEEYTRLFRILWTFDPENINKFGVFIPFRSKVVVVEQASSEKAEDLNLHYAEHRLVGRWLDLDDEQIRQIHDSLRPPPSTPPRIPIPAPPPQRKPLISLEAQRAPAPQQIHQTVVPTSMQPRRRGNGPFLVRACIIIIGLVIAIGLANSMFSGLRSLLAHQTATPIATTLPTDDPLCDTSQYSYGTSGHILCSSVPNFLKPIRRGHCLYEHLDDRDDDGAACESPMTPVLTQERVDSSVTVAPDKTDDPVCDLNRYERGTSGYILCSSVPNSLKLVPRGHCLYEHLDDRDGDGAVCERWNS